MSNRISIKKQTKWIQMTLYQNCFNDGEKRHIGFKHKGVYYILTHSRSKILIPKNCLRMNHLSEDPEYLAIATSIPKSINLTNMRISKSFFWNNILKKKEEPKKNIPEFNLGDIVYFQVYKENEKIKGEVFRKGTLSQLGRTVLDSKDNRVFYELRIPGGKDKPIFTCTTGRWLSKIE